MDPTNPVIKLSVLAGGELLLDGQPTTLVAVEQSLAAGAKENAAVWYYRENAGGEPHPVAMEVMKLVTRHRLPIRLSTRPDFSDAVAPKLPDLEKGFGQVRERAAAGQLVVVRSDGKHILLPALDKAAVSASMIAAVEQILPSSVKRNVAVVGDTAWAMAEKPDLRTANQAIPYFGLLMGFTTIGHAVWVFPASSVAVLAAGCRDADVLITDSLRLAKFPAGWQGAVAKTMREPKVLVYDAATSGLRLMTLGPA